MAAPLADGGRPAGDGGNSGSGAVAEDPRIGGSGAGGGGAGAGGDVTASAGGLARSVPNLGTERRWWLAAEQGASGTDTSVVTYRKRLLSQHRSDNASSALAVPAAAWAEALEKEAVTAKTDSGSDAVSAGGGGAQAAAGGCWRNRDVDAGNVRRRDGGSGSLLAWPDKRSSSDVSGLQVGDVFAITVGAGGSGGGAGGGGGGTVLPAAADGATGSNGSSGSAGQRDGDRSAYRLS